MKLPFLDRLTGGNGKCRYHKECRYYTNNYTCNHDSDANGYCGIFKEFRDFELEVKRK